MEASRSLKRISFRQDPPRLPLPAAAPTELDHLTSRTLYPDMDPPEARLKDYYRHEVSILSTERSLNVDSIGLSPPKKQLFPMPANSSRSAELSVGDLSRRGTEEVESIDAHAHQADQGEDYEQGEQVDPSEELEDKGPKFRKFRSQVQLPAFVGHYVPSTEAELRMEQRYLNSQNRDVKLKHEEEELIERMQAYGHRKARIVKNAAEKVEMRKAFSKTKLRHREPSRQPPSSREQSMSLPALRPKLVDTVKCHPPVEVNVGELPPTEDLSRREDSVRLREHLSTVLRLSGEERSDQFLQTLLNESLSSTKFYFRQDRPQPRGEFEESARMLSTVEDIFRRKRIPFDPNSLKRALLDQKTLSGELTRLPSLSLISNPYYKRWGL